MEKNSIICYVVIVEKCVMMEMVWCYIFSCEDNCCYYIYLFKNVSMFRVVEILFFWLIIIFFFLGSCFL